MNIRRLSTETEELSALVNELLTMLSPDNIVMSGDTNEYRNSLTNLAHRLDEQNVKVHKLIPEFENEMKKGGESDPNFIKINSHIMEVKIAIHRGLYEMRNACVAEGGKTFNTDGHAGSNSIYSLDDIQKFNNQLSEFFSIGPRLDFNFRNAIFELPQLFIYSPFTYLSLQEIQDFIKNDLLMSNNDEYTKIIENKLLAISNRARNNNLSLPQDIPLFSVEKTEGDSTNNKKHIIIKWNPQILELEKKYWKNNPRLDDQCFDLTKNLGVVANDIKNILPNDHAGFQSLHGIQETLLSTSVLLKDFHRQVDSYKTEFDNKPTIKTKQESGEVKQSVATPPRVKDMSATKIAPIAENKSSSAEHEPAIWINNIMSELITSLETEKTNFLSRKKLSEVNLREEDKKRYQVLSDLQSEIKQAATEATTRLSLGNYSPDTYHNALKGAINNALKKPQIEKYRPFQKVLLGILNFITGITIIPALIKKATKSNSFYYSLGGKPKETIEQVRKITNQKFDK